MKKWAWFIIVAMLLSAVPVLAGPPGGVPAGLQKIVTEDGEIIIGPPGLLKKVLPFGDMDEASWAIRYVANMRIRNLVQGYPDGKFRPNAAVSQAEAVVMVIRALGLEEEALELEGLPPLPGIQACRWAAGYILLAGEMNLIDLEEMQPNRAASRLWVTVLLVKALDLPISTGVIPFADASEVPADFRGYVAAAIQAGLLAGYEDATYRPNRSVSRAEMAALIERMLDLDPTTIIEGTLTMVTTTHIRVDGTHYDLAEEVVVVLDSNLVAYAALTSGYSVRVTLNSDGKVALIVATSVDLTYGGSIAALPTGQITLQVEDVLHTWSLASTYEVRLDGFPSTYPQLAVDFLAWVELDTDGRVTKITATSADTEYTGIVDYKTGSTLQLLVGDRLHALAVDNQVAVELDGEAADYDAVLLGYSVEVTLDADGLVAEITILDTVVIREGTIEALDGNLIGVKVGTIIYYFTVNDDAAITLDEEEAHLDDLLVGDGVRVETRAGYVELIEAMAKVTTTEGILVDVDVTEFTISLWGDDEVVLELDVLENAVISHDTEDDWLLADLNLGDLLEVKVVREMVREIEVVERLDTITGTITALDFDANTITVAGYLTFRVANDADIELDGDEEAVFEDLAVGDVVEITVSMNFALFIEAQAATTQLLGVVKSRDELKLTLWTANGEEVVDMAEAVEINTGGVEGDLDAIEEGSTLRLTIRRGEAIAAEILSLTTRVGEITSISGEPITLAVEYEPGYTFTGTLVAGAIILDETGLFEELEVGFTVEVQYIGIDIYVVTVMDTDS